MAYMLKVSVGEILDKLSILEIKLHYATDENQIANIKKEFNHLNGVAAPMWKQGRERLQELYDALKAINHQLWDIEDAIRLKEHAKDFEQEFIDLARKVYLTNDRRAEKKRAINSLLQSDFFEEKVYTNANYAES